MNNLEHILVQDEDSHWYVIPENKKEEWYKFFEDEEYPYKDLPNWAERVNGSPSNVTFKNYVNK
mgnify:CR=1